MIGVYIIKNSKNDKCYIGSSLNVRKRLNDHKTLLMRNKHHSYKLQGSYNKHGVSSFEFNPLEEVYFPETYEKDTKLEYLECLEGYYINKYNSYKKGYNVSEIPRIVGNANTKESIAKGIQTRRERGSYNISEITRQRRSDALKKSKPFHDAQLRTSQNRIKKVYQYDLDGYFLREFKSLQEASYILGICESMIRKSIKGIRCRCKSFIFSHKKHDRVSSFKERRCNLHRVVRYIDLYNSDGILEKRYNDYKEFADINKLSPDTVFSYINKNKSYKGYEIRYGERHK